MSGLQHSLRQAALNTVQRYTVQVSALQERLRRQDPLILLRGMLGKLEQLRMRMDNAAAQKTMQYQAKVEQLQARLSGAGPKQTLERGYAITMKNRIPVSSIKDMTGTVNIVMRDGTAVVNVLSTEEGDAFGS